ncbi:MAG TPA: DUF2167 domain-containing protein [Chitinophagaceae bacterium]|nr:DUF2167 domain-containing protein [Chitinophagaceae bacterium]
MRIPFLAGLCFSVATVFANDPTDSSAILQAQLKKIDSVESTLHYKTGKITVGNGIATINVPQNFKFLDAAEAKYIVEVIWGNLKGQSPLGMLVPAGSAASVADYAFLVEYQDLGYVKDDDATKINYDDLLLQLKKESADGNEARRKAGIPAMDLVGWAAAPYYDKAHNVLHWAKEYKVENYNENTLNYDVRVLGRKGVLVFQAVSDISQLDSVKQNIAPLLNAVSFTSGNAYADFDSKTDNVAAWTIGGLVAGKVLAKVGFFAIILKFLKVILLSIGGIGTAIWKFFKGRKKEEPALAYDALVPDELQH